MATDIDVLIKMAKRAKKTERLTAPPLLLEESRAAERAGFAAVTKPGTRRKRKPKAKGRVT
jgi:tRNA U34 5-methylaminomethyl-2-thiouridine-forming methyltransferase MnmC